MTGLCFQGRAADGRVLPLHCAGPRIGFTCPEEALEDSETFQPFQHIVSAQPQIIFFSDFREEARRREK